MLLDVPVLATKSSGTIDLVKDEETGLLVEATEEGVISGLERLRRDPSLCQRLKLAAHANITTNHTVMGMVSEMEKLYVEGAAHVRG